MFDYNNNNGMDDIFTIKEVENGWLVYVYYALDVDENEVNSNVVNEAVEGMVAAFAAAPILSKKMGKSFVKGADQEIEPWKKDSDEDEDEVDEDVISDEDVKNIGVAVKDAVLRSRSLQQPAQQKQGPSIYCFSEHAKLVEFVIELLQQLVGTGVADE